MLGKEILGYHVDEKIGSGGFGTVYKVSKTNVTGTYVRALKHIEVPTKRQYVNILNSMGGDSTKADDYFANILKNIVGEIKILSALSESGNQNIVRYYENDVIETATPKKYDIYILMEYLTPFPEYLDNTSLTVKDVIKLGKDILNALIACHGRNIIHRDIKDDNIFVASDGTFKIGDFGVSKALKDQSRAASIKGTPNFIAPEVYLGKDNYDHTVDLYSLGIVLYRLLNNLRNPFLPAFPNAYTSEDEDIAFEARMTGKIPELPNMAKNELGEAVLKAIKPRNERYNTAKEFLDALEKAEKTLSPIYLAQGIGIFNASQESEETVAFSNTDADTTMAASMFSGQAEVQNSNDDSDLFKTIGLFNDDDENVNREEPTQQEQDSNKTIALENDDLADNAQSAESGNTDEEEHAPDKENLGSSFVESQNKTDLVENKQKNKKRFLPLILIVGIVLFVILLVTFIFIGVFRGNTSASVEFKTLNLVGTNAYGSVSNSVTTFSFADEIGAKEIKKYKLCKNADGTQPIVGGVVDLAIGDNYFYLFGSGNNGKKLYTISIRRRPVYNVVLEIDDEQTSYLVEEGSMMLTPNAPEKEGYDFLGWNYDFAVPVSRDLVITPMWDLKEFTVSWRECKNATITVKRISSYNSSATKGTLAVGDVIYYGDVLSVQYTADAGFLLSSKGATSITVSGNVTSSNIYANVKPNSYVATWSTPTGCSITVKRTSSPYALASTGALSNGSAIYYGDVLSVEYTADTGFSLSNIGNTYITVKGNVTSSSIYATVVSDAYTVTWNTAVGCTIIVERTSSPYANATEGQLDLGDLVYYGDVLSVTYLASDGYSLSDFGKTDITVDSNVTASDIYATVTPNEYTYNIVYRSSNGTDLGISSATYAYDTTNVIEPKVFSGYDTPESQSVTWDDVSGKTIAFIYTPSVVTNSAKTGILGDELITYSAKVEYRNRTANSVEVRVIWTTTVGKGAKMNNGIILKASVGSITTGEVKVLPHGTWPSEVASSQSKSGNTGWIKITLDTTNIVSKTMELYAYQCNYYGDSVTWDGYDEINTKITINIPAY